MENDLQKPMYNINLKERFIEFKGKSYLGKLRSIFRKSYLLETELNKDVYHFNQEEMEQLFALLNFKNVVDTYNSIKYYLDYCKDQEGIIDKNIIVSVSPHHFEDFTENKSLRFKEESINSFISQCINAQDRLILRLLFEGVYGEDISELRNLKKSDVSWETNTLRLNCDISGPRQIRVTNECMALIKESIKTNVQYYHNGEIKSGILYEYYCDNDYLIRTIRKKAKNPSNRVGRSLLISRFKLYQTWFNVSVTPYSVYKSGMISHAINVSKKLGIHINEFRHEKQWSNIAKIYPMPSREVNGIKQYYSLFDEIKKANEIYGDYLVFSFEPLDETKVDKDIVERKKRSSATKFKKMILEAYDRTCAVTGETTEAVLEACHIQNFINEESDNYQNGILLRIDIHRLFDKGLIQINDDYTVSVSSKVLSDYYQQFNGTKLILPRNIKWAPSKIVLRYRNENYFVK